MKKISLIMIIIFIFLLLNVKIIDNALPEKKILELYKPPVKSKIFDRKNKILKEIYVQKRTEIKIKKIKKNTINAFIVAEDINFYKHNGIDYISLFKAILNEIKFKIIGGNRIGGSTITQQLSRTIFLENEKTYLRKIKEIFIAKKLEKIFDKKELINKYLNQIYFGNGVYGIEEASIKYYKKKSSEISLKQSAELASIPKNPNKINPLFNTYRLKNRRNYILKKMLENNLITKYEFNKAVKEKEKIKQKKNKKEDYLTDLIKRIMEEKFSKKKISSNGFKIYTTINKKIQKIAKKTLKKNLKKIEKKNINKLIIKENIKTNEIKEKVKEIKNLLFKNKKNINNKIWNLKNIKNFKNLNKENIKNIISVKKIKKNQNSFVIIKKVDYKNNEIKLDLGSKKVILKMPEIKKKKTQNDKAKIFNEFDIIKIKIKETNPIKIKIEKLPKIQGAIIVINPKNNELVAVSGGYSFKYSKFNRATQAKRQPGSAIKPFVYSVAVEKKKFMPNEIILDIPKAFINIKENNEYWWKPKNHTGKFSGDINLKTCLLKSINTCSVSLLEKIGIKNIIKLAKKINLITNHTPFQNDLTISLGSSNVIPIDLVNAYTIFPNMGKFANLRIIKKIKTNNNKIIYKNKKKKKQIINPQTAFLITNILRDVIKEKKEKKHKSQAGKTGTSNKMKSLWFIGYTQNLVTGIYIGYDNNKSLKHNEYAANVALPIWKDFMKKIKILLKKEKFKEPIGITWKKIKKEKNKKNNDYLNVLEAFSENFQRNEKKENKKITKKGGLSP